MTSSDAAGIRALRDSFKKKQSLVRSVVLHAGQGRPLDIDILALPWGWMVAAAWLKRECQTGVVSREGQC